MLNKLDLTKKFELVVQQEIQNYQKSLNNVLQTIRDIKISIETMQTESLESYALIHTIQSNQSTEQDRIKSDLNTKIDQIGSKLVDLCGKVAKIVDLSSELRINIDKQNEKYVTLEQKLDGIFKDVDQVKISLRVNKKSSEEDYAQALRQIKDSFACQKKQIEETPSQLSKAKKEIDERLNTHIVDVESVLKELTEYKKQNHVTQKHIEHIYTLIERLKK